MLVAASLSMASAGEPSASYVGGAVCATCHGAEADAWRGSHHDLAMQPATATTVLGDFDDASFTAYGVTSRFVTRDGRFFVTTEGPDGALHDYEIAYTFGVDPLQQYLIAFPGGRYQVLGIGWDSRPEEQGGQRWFHLYEGEHISAGDELHWTGINQNWNFMCAECHSTNLRRGYNFESDRFETTWSEVNVSCEACHGPGSEHVAWAERTDDGEGDDDASKGLIVSFLDRDGVSWGFDDGTVTASRTPPPAAFRTEVETCAPCHSRRAPIGDGFESGKPLLDSYRLSLLTEPLYHADGQIKDEVYVYGSFLQSKMYRAGVTCSDCHDPHSLKLKAEGNAVCTQCHAPDHFDAAVHHFHESDSPGAACVACHAPETTYMVVDPRRDHSFRAPRPDLSVELGVPNACNRCHDDRSASWAAARVAEWYGEDRPRSPHFAEALAAGRFQAPGAAQKLAVLARDPAQPAIARATAVEVLGQGREPAELTVILESLNSQDALIRFAAVDGLEALHPRDRLRVAFPLLEDPVRAVRLAAARVLAPVALEVVPPPQAKVLSAAFDAYVHSLRSTANRPESLITLGNFYMQAGNVAEAEKLLQTAIDRHPSFTPAYGNLADVYRATGRDGEGERLLHRGVEVVPDDAALAYALGLLYVRQQRYPEAQQQLARAALLAPDNPRYGYVYALALQQAGKLGEAGHVLRRTLVHHPNDRDILYALASQSLEAGDRTAAAGYAERLLKLSPGDPRVQNLFEGR
jgi:Tfp pilus assembly protein PilF